MTDIVLRVKSCDGGKLTAMIESRDLEEKTERIVRLLAAE